MYALLLMEEEEETCSFPFFFCFCISSVRASLEWPRDQLFPSGAQRRPQRDWTTMTPSPAAAAAAASYGVMLLCMYWLPRTRAGSSRILLNSRFRVKRLPSNPADKRLFPCLSHP